jgi:hypothetical protein
MVPQAADGRIKQLAADSFIMSMSEVELRATLMGLNARHPGMVLDEIALTLTVSRAS